MIQIGKGIVLNLPKFCLPYVGAKSQRGSGGIAGVQKPGNQGKQCADAHLNTFLEDEIDVAVLYAYVDDIRHDQGNGKFEGSFCDDQKDTQDKFFFKRAKMSKNTFQVLQENNPFLQNILLHIMEQFWQMSMENF